MRCKLFISDIDGTLVNSAEAMTPALLATLDTLRQAGLPFTLASGRTFRLMVPFIRQLGIMVPYITSNGACIFQEDRCLIAHTFSIEPVIDLLYRADAAGMTVTVSDAYEEMPMRVTPYVQAQRALGDRLMGRIDLSQSQVQKAAYAKVMIYDPNRSDALVSLGDAVEAFSDSYAITRFSNKAIELGPPGCNKASGVRELAALMSVSMDEVMAFGDYQNDLEMLAAVGCGVAVGNAMPAVKQVADYVATGCYGDGIAEAIDTLCAKEAGGHAG